MKVLTAGWLLAVALVLAACTTTQVPHAAPDNAAPDPTFPARPFTVDVQSRDPCRTIRQAQADQYKYDFISSERSDFGPSLPGCSYLQLGKVTYTVQFLKYTPAERLLPGPAQEGTRDTENAARASDLDGFGAVESRLTRGSPSNCVVTVDTGPTSSVQFIYSPLTPADSPAELRSGCDKARQFAHLGLQNLSSD